MKKWENDNGTVTVAPTFSYFPMSAWHEWDNDCKNHFGNQRWVKAYNDHRLAQLVHTMQAQIDELKSIIVGIKQEQTKPQPKEEPKGIRTLGGNFIKTGE